MGINSLKVTKAVTNDLTREETDHFTSHPRHQYHTISTIVQFSHSAGLVGCWLVLLRTITFVLYGKT